MPLGPVLGSVLGSALSPALGEGVGGNWWPSGSLQSADYENSRFRDPNGVLYTSEAAYNTAMGASKSGEARTFSPVPTGAELLADGGFSSGVDGWAVGAGTAANGSVAQLSNQLRAAWNGTATNLRYRKTVTTTADKAYIFKWTCTARNNVASGLISASSNGDLFSSDGLAQAAAGVENVLVHGAEATTTYFGANINANGTSIATTTEDIDTASLKECIPYTGFTVGSLSADISFTTPSSFPGTQVVRQWGSDGERARVRLQVDNTGALSLIVTRAGAAQAALALGTLSISTRYRVKLACTTNRFSASLDGAPIVTDTAGTFPGIGRVWTGRSFTGETFTGTIHNVHDWAEALSDAALVSPFKAMVIWGDSLATTTGASVAANAWWNLLAADLGWTVVSKGVGGNDTATELSRFNSETETAYRSWLNIFIDRPNTGEASADWLTNVAAMAAQVSRWFVVPPVLNSASGLPDTSATTVNAVKAALLAGSWVGHSLGSAAQASLQATMDNDNSRIGGGDWTHFDDSGHVDVKVAVKAGLQAVGLAA